MLLVKPVNVSQDMLNLNLMTNFVDSIVVLMTMLSIMMLTKLVNVAIIIING